MTRLTVDDVAEALAPIEATRTCRPFGLSVGGYVVEVRCTSDRLRATLLRHLQHVICPPAAPDVTVHVLGARKLPFPVQYKDWAREPGKTGRKDAIFDLDGGRLISKVRTGMTFLQSPDWAIAFGPADAHPNQVINFINTQILNHFQRAGWVACHAAAISANCAGLAISGLSGGGKSTAILRLMEISGTRYVTNDRLLVRACASRTEALGIPKLPRINPGTIVSNPRFAGTLTGERARELRAMAPDALWHLEEKHDLFIDDTFGPGRISHSAHLTNFWILNWTRHSDAPTRLNKVRLAHRPDLLSAIMKSPGPFYQQTDGPFWSDATPNDDSAYLTALARVQVWEVTGAIDFNALYKAGSDFLGQPQCPGGT